MNGPRQVKGVPYCAQWESPELVKDFLSGRLAAADDPRWASSGARSPQEYEFWSWRACGMACLKMMIRYWGLADRPIVTLAKEALEYGAYVHKGTSVAGLIYRPFTHYVAEAFGLHAESCSELTLDELIARTSADALAVASVHHTIRRPSSVPPHRGGHLVLVVGHDGDTVVIHNPSGDSSRSQSFAEVKVDDFNRFYANRGIIVHPA